MSIIYNSCFLLHTFYFQTIGYFAIGEVGKIIAKFLGLLYPDTYTGHFIRASSATFAFEAGGTKQQVKQIGTWKSDSVVDGYHRNSDGNRMNLANMIATNLDGDLGFLNTNKLTITKSCIIKANKKVKITLDKFKYVDKKKKLAAQTVAPCKTHTVTTAVKNNNSFIYIFKDNIIPQDLHEQLSQNLTNKDFGVTTVFPDSAKTACIPEDLHSAMSQDMEKEDFNKKEFEDDKVTDSVPDHELKNQEPQTVVIRLFPWLCLKIL